MKTIAEIQDLIAAKKDFLLSRFGIAHLVVYGSYAKGKATDSSDLDLMYELADGCGMTLTRLQNLEQFFRDLLQVDKIELVRKQFMEPIISAAVQKEGVAIF
jgi:predicted nucleotidyltransferase